MSLLLFLGLLTSCKSDGLLRPELASKQAESTSPETAPDAENTIDGIGAPVAIPPRFNDSPPKPGETGTEYTEATGLPSLQPMKGVNIESLFAERIKDSDKRFERLENAVLEMRKEFESVKPSIIRLVAVETDMQNLTKELETLLQETPETEQPLDLSLPETQENATLQVQQLDPQPPSPETLTPEVKKPQDSQPSESLTQEPTPVAAETPPQTAKEPAPPEKPEEASAPPTLIAQKAHPPTAPPAKASGNVARNFRIGEHADKIRVVMDTGDKPLFTVDYDDTENLIIVEIENMSWEGGSSRDFPDSDLISSYTVTPSNGGKGSTIVINLKKKSRILTQKLLSPDENPNHRIYFDLAP